MAIVAEFTIPPDALPGGSALKAMPDVRIELERIVPSNDAVLPYFWVFGANTEDFLSRVENEPQIENLRVLAEQDHHALFEAEWRPTAEVISGIKRLKATIMDATGTADGWHFQVRADSRDRLMDFQRVFSDQGIPVELNRLYDFTEVPANKRPLTSDQHETLLVAYRTGYFDEPRRATQQDLAEQFEISPRAISDRLRRGMRNLVASALVDSLGAEDE